MNATIDPSALIAGSRTTTTLRRALSVSGAACAAAGAATRAAPSKATPNFIGRFFRDFHKETGFFSIIGSDN
jgi:hypothetical protein